MAVDFTKYRVDVDNALGQAISSRDTNAVQTETTNQKIQAHSRAFERAGAALNRGITQALDPTRGLAQQAAIRNSQAQQEDLARQNAGLAIRSQASYQKPSSILGTDLSNPADIAEKIHNTKSPGGIPYKELPPDMRQRFEANLGQIANQDMLVNKANDKQVLALGSEYGSEKNVGLTMSRARQRLTELGNMAYEETTKDPAYQKMMMEVNERRQLQADAHSKGDYVTEQVIKDNPNNKKLQQMAPAFSTAVRNGEVMMTPLGAMTLNQYINRGGGTVQGMHELMRSSVDQYPAMGIEGTGDKGTVLTTWDDRVVKNAAAKDTESEPFAKALSGQPMASAYSKWSGHLGTKAALQELIKDDADWRKKLTGAQAQLATGKINALKADIDKYGLAAVAAELGNTSGVATMPQGVMQQANVFGKKGSMAAVRARLQSISGLSQDAKGLLTTSLDPSKPSMLEQLVSKAYEDGMAKGPFDAGPGPLAPFKNMGIDEGDLAVMAESVMAGAASQPNFGVLLQQLQMGGVKTDAAHRIVAENLPEFDAAMDRGFSTPDSKGVMPRDWPKAEQEGLKNDIAEDFARTHVHAYASARDSENAEMMNWLGGKPEGTLPYNDANEIARTAITANPDLVNKTVDLEQKDGGALRVFRGEPVAQRLPDGKWVGLKNPDPFKQRYTESLHIGSKVYASRMEEAKQRGNATPGKGNSGDPRLDAILNESMPGGSSVYDYASNLLNQHPHMGSKSDDWGLAIGTHLNNRGLAQGLKSFELSKALNDAAERTRDPVIDGLATFVAESLSPQPNTRRMLAMVEGHSPTEMIRSAGEAQAQEKVEKDSGVGRQTAADFLQKGTEVAASRPSEAKPPKDWSYPEDPVYEKSWQEKQDERTAKGDPGFNPTSMGVGAGVGMLAGPPGAALVGGGAAALESARVQDVEAARARIETAQQKAKYEKRFGPGTWETGGQPEKEPDYQYGWQAKGIKVQGNISLMDRPIVRYKDGSYSTVRTISIGTDQGEVLIPTVVKGEGGGKARVLSNEEAIEHYRKTGEHFGIFETRRDADRAAKQLHDQQERVYGPKMVSERSMGPPAAPEEGPASRPSGPEVKAESRPGSRPESRPASRPAAPAGPEDPFVEMLRKATTRAEQIRRGEKPSAEAPGRSRFLGPRAESRPSTTPPKEEQARLHTQAMTRRFGEGRGETQIPPPRSPPASSAEYRVGDRQEAERIYRAAAAEPERRRAAAQAQIDQMRAKDRIKVLTEKLASNPGISAADEQERQSLLQELDQLSTMPSILNPPGGGAESRPDVFEAARRAQAMRAAR